jgi:glutamate--cysteine ligase
MFGLLHDRLDSIARIAGDAVLQDGSKGMEKESLRVTPDGSVSMSAHPAALGSALTHPWITTDFSEALVELVTPPLPTSWETLQYLCDLHQFVYGRIGDEMLWATSMPCAVSGDESIPIAVYGDSNSGRMKHIYRQGLSHRYGRVMQAIAGVHFNYSLPEAFWDVYRESERSEMPLQSFRNDAYFGLLRNYRRFGWLVLYLFGASPAICKSFLGGRSVDLPDWDPWTVYGPHATTLRMSDLGYRNANQAGVNPSMNDLGAYVADLDRAIRTPFAEYENLGARVDGQWRQLNTSILQIENEYYGFIRPKQIAMSGERPTRALQERGVAYVEVRSLDVSPLDPVGVSQNEMRFLEALLIMCLLSDSPPMTAAEADACDANHLAVAVRGRDPELGLTIGGRTRSLRDWGVEVVDSLRPVCALLDAGAAQACYQASLDHQLGKILDPGQTPSARVLAAMGEKELSFFEFATDLSRRYRDYFRNLPAIEPARLALLEQEVADSLRRNREMEARDEIPFEEFLARYYEG